MSKAAGEEETTGDVATGVTWSDIYESPRVDRSLRRLPRLCREAVRLVLAAAVPPADRRGSGAAS